MLFKGSIVFKDIRLRAKIIVNIIIVWKLCYPSAQNLLETLEQWTEIINEGDGIVVAYLELRKAFYIVSHECLIYKLSKYGINRQILNWIKDFLNDRTQRVVIRGTASSSREVTSGVPQGSVLGPILFLIFINDLPWGLLSKLGLFADDSKLFSRIVSNKNKSKYRDRNGSRNLQEDLNRVVEWARKLKMEFNIGKCKIMHLGYNNPRTSYRMEDIRLEVIEEERDWLTANLILESIFKP